ncbi:polyprenyl synthetase [Halopelagius fulvigenes]|uniref:Polyprenyl synthetase n=1 Tax=Halopelagius fulvigenes TaxID=1198324 RepID=A0ABD5U3Y7_9EURY
MNYPNQVARIDAQLASVACTADQAGVTLVRRTLEELDDRWYGKFVVGVYGSLADAPDIEAVIPAATAIELLRGYCRLRSELLVQVTDERAHSLSHDESTALLAGDYLYTSAYSLLDSLGYPALGACSEILTDVLMDVTAAFVTGYRQQSPSKLDSTAFFDATTGTIGEGAALLGATLARAEENKYESIARVGRGYSTSRQIRRILGADPGLFKVVPRLIDESKLQTHADFWRENAEVALCDLSTTTDVTPLRLLVEANE